MQAVIEVKDAKIREKDAKAASFDQRFTTARSINAKQEARIEELETKTEDLEVELSETVQNKQVKEKSVKIEEQSEEIRLLKVKLAEKDEEVKRQTRLTDGYIALNQRLLGL